MANGAMAQLEAQIESIRREAYQQDYEAAMRAVTEFALAPAKLKTAETRGRSRQTKSAPTPRRAQPKGTAARRRTGRGGNARQVADALRGLPDRTGPAAAIRKALASDGISMAYTSIRHALGQLQTRGEVSVAEDGKTWSYTAPT